MAMDLHNDDRQQAAAGVSQRPAARGRGSQLNPPNRFARIYFEEDLEHLEYDEEARATMRARPTDYFIDHSKSVVSENNSPDIPFRYSLNPYRGCAHGCSYCYARPTHEYYDLNAGLDFESKIFVKLEAPRLFRQWLGRPGYEPQPITLSGVTDCYQPIERKLRLTRQCLEVALECGQPMALVTKNASVTRDLDVLSQMARQRIVSVALSITTLDPALGRVMEPRTSAPAARLSALRQLAHAGVPVHVLVAPVIPGLTDHEIPEILREAQAQGAESASYILLRLPLTVQPVFLEWLQRTQPAKAQKIESRIRSTRGGKLYEGKFGVRMRGQGEIADQIRNLFKLFQRRFGLDPIRESLDCSQFRRPAPESGQQWLFPA